MKAFWSGDEGKLKYLAGVTSLSILSAVLLPFIVQATWAA
jgi:hypothetical protein